MLLAFLFVAMIGYVISYLYYSGMNDSRDIVQAQSIKHESRSVDPEKVRSGILRIGHGAKDEKGDREMSFRYAL